MTDRVGAEAEEESPGEESPGEDAGILLLLQLAALAEIARAERELEAAFWAALVEFLTAVWGSLRVAQIPDVSQARAQLHLWARLVDQFLEGPVRAAWERAALAVLGPDFDPRPATAAHLAEVRNRLVGVADEVFDRVRATIAEGQARGSSIPEIAQALEDLLRPGNPVWPGRARTIARTESLAALNAGRLDSFRQVAEALPDRKFQKQWLATLDNRVRPTHRRADGQRRSLGHRFQVGTASLRFPGDPLGPPQEIVACRCTLVLVEDGHPVAVDNRGWRSNDQ